MKKHTGFTLIEILLVAGIISVLLSLIFFNVSEARKKADDAHMKAESGQVARAIYQYQEDNGGKVPGHLNVTGPATLVEGSAETGEAYNSAMRELVAGGYLSEIPTSPSGEAYAYVISADETEAVFAADLNFENGNGENDSCPLTSDGGDGGESCVEPDFPPEYYDVYGYGTDYFTMGQYQYPKVWLVYDTPSSPTNVTGTCSSYPDLYNTVFYGEFDCIDLPGGLAQAQQICSSLDTTSCNGLSGSNVKAMLYYQHEVDNYTQWKQDYEQPYIEAYDEYSACVDEQENGGGDGDEEEGGICDGSSSSDYCSCI